MAARRRKFWGWGYEGEGPTLYQQQQMAKTLAGMFDLDEIAVADPPKIDELELPEPRVYPDRVVAHVLYVDGFGNVALNIGHEGLSSTFLRLGHKVVIDTGRARITVPFGRTFADVGEGQGLLYEDSSRNLALAINRDSAGALLALAPDDEVTLLPAEG